MKNTCLAAILALLFVSTACARAEVLTLEQAMDLAERNHPTIEQLQAAVEQSGHLLNQARASLHPTLDYQFEITSTVDDQGSSSPLAAMFASDEGEFTNTFNLSYSLYDPTRNPGIRAREHSMAAGELELERFRDELRVNIFNAFLMAFLAGEAQWVQQQSQSYFSELRDVALVRFEQGLIPKNDYLTFANSFDQALISAKKYDYDRRLALLALENLMNQPVPQDTVLEKPIPVEIMRAQGEDGIDKAIEAFAFENVMASMMERLLDEPATFDMNGLLLEAIRTGDHGVRRYDTDMITQVLFREALNQRLGIELPVIDQGGLPAPDTLALAADAAADAREDVRATEEKIDSAKASARQAQGSKKPQINVGATYQHTENSITDLDSKDDITVVLAQLNWRLRDGRSRDAQIKAAEAQIRQLEAGLAALKWGVRAQILDAYFKINYALARLAYLENTIRDARKNLEIIDLRYREGLLIVTEVTSARLSLEQAQLQQISAAVDLGVGLRRLELALGGENQ